MSALLRGRVTRRREALVWVTVMVFVALMLAAFAATPTWGQTTAPAAPAPSVAFTDDQAITVNLPELRRAKLLRVALTNLLGSKQAVKVSVVGLRTATGTPDAFATGLFADSSVALPPRDSASAEIPVLPDSGKQPAAQYTGSIVAVGRRGPIVRIGLTVNKDGPPVIPSPVPYPDVTLTAVNYAPSILSPLGPGLLALGLIALLIGLALRQTLKAIGPLLILAGIGASALGGALGAFGEHHLTPAADQVPAALVIIAVSFFAFWAVFAVQGRRTLMFLAAAGLVTAGLINSSGADLTGQRSASLVATKPVPVPKGSISGRVGGASSPNGDVIDLNVAELRPADPKVTDLRLVPKGIRRAGAFDGKIDLNGSAIGGDSKATVNARDWWLWGLLTIALGIGVGYVVRRYFTRDRPRELAQTQLKELWRDIASAESAFATKAAGQPYAVMTMLRRARARVKDIRRLLDEDNLKDATTGVAALRKQADEFAALRLAAAGLGVLAAQLRLAVTAQAFGVDPGHIVALRMAHGALANDADPENVDAGDKALTSAAKAIDDAAALIKALLPVHADVAAYLATAQILKLKAPDETAKDGREFVDVFLSLGSQLLAVSTPDGVGTVRTANESAGLELQAAVRKQHRARVVSDDDVRNMAATEMTADGAVVRLSFIDGPTRSVFLSTGQPPSLTATVIGPNADAPGWNGDGDDVFELAAELRGPGTPSTVQWRLGDETDPIDQPINVVDGVATAHLRHQFEGADPTIGVRIADEDGKKLTSGSAIVYRPGRAASARMAFGIQDREMSLLAALLALGSGMVALYFAQAAWGAPKDYLAAALWGGGVSESVKLLGTLVSRVFPDVG
jgi:hypothetical protein